MPNAVLTERDIFEYASYLGFGEINMEVDHTTGMHAIIAVHSNKLGPAIGGTRFVHYESSNEAIIDALRLAAMMSYKAAICGLKHGGGKAVIIKSGEIKNREALFERFGKFVHRIEGRYIAAMDSGTSMADMDSIAKSTDYVTCTTKDPGNGNPAPHTALGVFRGLQAAVKFKMAQDSLQNVHVALQGVGNVGYFLAKLLHEQGAKLTVCDVNNEAVQRCVEEFGATAVDIGAIYDVACDVFSPCALGSSINPKTIDRLKCKIVAGAANNQLAHRTLDEVLHHHNILFAPDFLINAGGLIHVAEIYDHGDETLGIFDRAQAEDKPTNYIARTIAEERLNE
jgi:leucine dehydrogenase